ncbi:MAG: hypothetical protein CL678_01670 [Bdellovibrionaceae bacterium]|nr:hypothetical protein [Pseudobdellovibrionaceae bacterium]|tara:strand:- start:4156 stop:5310 length:1155 start_codon:yes stop_codon:yes gene_type:complete
MNTHPIDIVSFHPSDKSLTKKFIGFPWKIYNKKDHPQWVPPLRATVWDALDTEKNPFYKKAEIQLFMATRNGQWVGRIAAIDNHAHNEFHKDQVGFYGFFECIDDQEVANRLFDVARTWLKKRGKTHMRGPMSPSTNHECGLLVRGQSQHPTLMTTWNPKYYQELHEKAGFSDAKDLVAYLLPTEFMKHIPEEKIQRAKQKLAESGFKFRDFDLKNFDREIEICFDIYNSAWEDNWGFVPMTQEEFIHAAKDMKMLVDPRFAFIAEKDGKAAGFMLALPDFNWIFKRIKNGRLFPTGVLKILLGKRFLKTVRILTLGVKSEYRKEGIFNLFTYESFRRAKEYGVVAGEASWILEDNEAMNRPWKELQAPLYRRWRIYDQDLSSM